MFQIRTLIVDDLPDMRDTLARILKDADFEVFKASSIEEALAILQTTRVHVAVLDVRLDENDKDNEDGLALMYQIRRLDPTIAIIILTGYASVKMVQVALQPDKAGEPPAFDFLQKEANV